MYMYEATITWSSSVHTCGAYPHRWGGHARYDTARKYHKQNYGLFYYNINEFINTHGNQIQITALSVKSGKFWISYGGKFWFSSQRSLFDFFCRRSVPRCRQSSHRTNVTALNAITLRLWHTVGRRDRPSQRVLSTSAASLLERGFSKRWPWIGSHPTVKQRLRRQPSKFGRTLRRRPSHRRFNGERIAYKWWVGFVLYVFISNYCF